MYCICLQSLENSEAEVCSRIQFLLFFTILTWFVFLEWGEFYVIKNLQQSGITVARSEETSSQNGKNM